MENNSKTICHTGSSGSIGKYLNTWSIPLFDRLESTIESHLTELKSLRSTPECLIHLSAATSVEECEKNPNLAQQLNAIGTLKWYQAAALAGIKRFIYISTAHVYAPVSPPHKLKPTDPVAPKSVYAKSKLEGEQLILNEAKANTSQTEVIIARVFSVRVEEENKNFLIPSLHRRAREKNFAPIPGLRNVRDFLTPLEIAQRLATLAVRKEHEPIVNICSGKPTIIFDLAAEIFESHGIDRSNIVEAPARNSDNTWIVGEPSEI